MSQRDIIQSKYNTTEDKLLTEILKPTAFRSLSKIESYLSQNNIDPNKVSTYGNNAIHHAAKMGNAAALQMLIDAGADPTKRNHVGATPLIVASRGSGRGHTSCVKLLLELDCSYDIDVNAMCVEGRTALRQAILGPNVRSVELLLQHGSDLSWNEHEILCPPRDGSNIKSKKNSPCDEEPIAIRFASWLSAQYQTSGNGYTTQKINAFIGKVLNPYKKILVLLHKAKLVLVLK